MKRHAVYPGNRLPGNRSTVYPNRQLYLDTETSVCPGGTYRNHRFRLGWTRYVFATGRPRDSVDRWDLWRNLHELNAFIERCTAERNALYIYGHNLYYDLQVIGFFRHFAHSGWQLDFVYDKGMTFVLVIRKGKRSIHCVSTTNYFDYSLSALAKQMGMKKHEVDPLSASDEKLIPYCRQDVAILVEAVKQYRAFNSEHDTGKFAATRASQSFNCYRHRFMNEAIYIHRDKRVSELERFAYFGGRTEAFRWGRQKGGPFVFLDVNSMYPYVMHRYRYPTKLIEYLENVPIGYAQTWLPCSAMVADATVEITEPMIAYRGKEKVLFPVGRFRTGLCSEGLRRLFEQGAVIQIHRLAVYECRFIFREYVEYFYPLKSAYKQEGNEIYTAIVKLFLNSLYGKFGQKVAKEEIHDNPQAIEPYRWDEIEVSTGDRWTRTGMFGKEIIQFGETEGRNAFVAIAAHVTEYARFVLWDYFCAADREKVIYCDTDSLVLGEVALRDCAFSLNDSALGALSLDKRTEELVIYNPKDYQTDEGRKTKGVPRSAKQIGPHTWTYEQFLRLSSHQRLGIGEGFRSIMTTKSVSIEYDKGIVLPSGEILPYCLGGS